MQALTNNLFKALSDPTRRAILERLARDGEQTVHALTDRAGVSQPAVSKHLRILKCAKLVRDRREGRETHYSAHPQALAPLIDWMSHYDAFWRERFEQLESLLKIDGPMTNPDTPRSVVIEGNAASPGKNLARTHANLLDTGVAHEE